jgi:DNA-binding protein YbaB
MTGEQAQGLMGMPLKKLAEMCKDPEVLAEVISIAFNKGYELGHRTAHENMNKAFRGYSESLIKN